MATGSSRPDPECGFCVDRRGLSAVQSGFLPRPSSRPEYGTPEQRGLPHSSGVCSISVTARTASSVGEAASRLAACNSRNTSSRWTCTSRGAWMPSRITSPRASSTVMITSFPIITLSPARRVSTSIVRCPPPSVDGHKGRGHDPGDRAEDGSSVRPVHDRANRVPGAAQHHLHRPHGVAVEHDRRQQVGGGLVHAGGDDRQQQETVGVPRVQGGEHLVLDLRGVVREERLRRGHEEAELRVLDGREGVEQSVVVEPHQDELPVCREPGHGYRHRDGRQAQRRVDHRGLNWSGRGASTHGHLRKSMSEGWITLAVAARAAWYEVCWICKSMIALGRSTSSISDSCDFTDSRWSSEDCFICSTRLYRAPTSERADFRISWALSRFSRPLLTASSSPLRMLSDRFFSTVNNSVSVPGWPNASGPVVSIRTLAFGPTVRVVGSELPTYFSCPGLAGSSAYATEPGVVPPKTGRFMYLTLAWLTSVSRMLSISTARAPRDWSVLLVFNACRVRSRTRMTEVDASPRVS